MISFPRRIAAVLYDAIAILTILYFASFAPVLVTDSFIKPETLGFQFFLFILTATYFIFCWHRSQTLGMAAWHLHLQNDVGQQPTAKQLVCRFLLAVVSILFFGFGYLWALIDPYRKTFHDRVSGTYLVYRK
tara:strand:- start:983 stop:1378 length:396 start_codon:yes stop_codon:yes gene_type:complete